MLFKSSGVMDYNSEGTRAVLNIDQNIADYYRSLIPKYKVTNKTRWPAHITVVRIGKERAQCMDTWGKHQGQEIEFYYKPVILEGSVYFWLDAYSQDLEMIKIQLGLPLISYRIPTKGFDKIFHFTIANKKL